MLLLTNARPKNNNNNLTFKKLHLIIDNLLLTILEVPPVFVAAACCGVCRCQMAREIIIFCWAIRVVVFGCSERTHESGSLWGGNSELPIIHKPNMILCPKVQVARRTPAQSTLLSYSALNQAHGEKLAVREPKTKG